MLITKTLLICLIIAVVSVTARLTKNVIPSQVPAESTSPLTAAAAVKSINGRFYRLNSFDILVEVFADKDYMIPTSPAADLPAQAFFYEGMYLQQLEAQLKVFVVFDPFGNQNPGGVYDIKPTTAATK